MSTFRAVGSLDKDQVRRALATATRGRDSIAGPELSCLSTDLGFEIRSTGSPPPSLDGSAGRELLLCCGRSVLHLRVAIRAMGVHPTVRLLPDNDHRELLAVVLPQGHARPTADDLALVDALRRLGGSHRKPAVTTLPPSTITRLRQAAKVEQAWLAILGPAQVTELLEPLDAVPHADQDCNAVEVIAVIGSLRDAPIAQLQSGQAVERVLLTAVVARVGTELIPQLIAVTASRRRLRDVIGGGLWPQGVIRFGGRAGPDARMHGQQPDRR